MCVVYGVCSAAWCLLTCLACVQNASAGYTEQAIILQAAFSQAKQRRGQRGPCEHYEAGDAIQRNVRKYAALATLCEALFCDVHSRHATYEWVTTQGRRSEPLPKEASDTRAGECSTTSVRNIPSHEDTPCYTTAAAC
jgi:hypothetical protein